jgi:hypothetical protein
VKLVLAPRAEHRIFLLQMVPQLPGSLHPVARLIV